MSDITRFMMVFTVGVIFIIAGIKGWKFPGTYWFIRNGEYGEIINMILTAGVGACFIMLSFYVFF